MATGILESTAVIEQPILPDGGEIPVANVLPANREFPEGVWLNIHNVPVFAEHSTVASNGRDLTFGHDELSAVCDSCNRRIRETGDYAGIIVGHTPDPADAAGLPAMPLVGLAGPFQMGLIRQHDGQTKWAILADFHIQREKEHLIREYPRRSPELWMADDYKDMYLDPIALLGAEAPRLDMGLLYSAVCHRDGRLTEVEKYSACAPSATSVFIPGGDDRKDYSAADVATTATSTDQEPIMQPEDLQQIVAAIEQLDWVQEVKQMLAERTPEADVHPIPDPGDSSPAVPVAPDTSVLDATPNPEDSLPVRYSRLSSEVTELRGTVSNLQKELETERGRIEEERAKRVNTERYSLLSDRRRTRAFDLEKEFESLKYGKATDEQFTAHVERIDANYREIPLDTSLPTFGQPASTSPDRPGGAQNREKYSKEVSDKALQIAKRKSLAGEPVSYEEVLEQVASGEL